MSYKHKLRSNLVSWGKLPLSQKISVLMLFGLLLVIPLAVIMVVSPKDILTPDAATVDTVDSKLSIGGNTSPVIVDNTLDSARVGANYSASVEGYDQDINDGLSMSVSNLPPGLSQGKCRASKDRRDNVRRLTCSIEGTPTSIPGSYLIDIVLSDDKGGVAKKTNTLQVN
jgi:hypothetical protein